jgi:hypothetical protein
MEINGQAIESGEELLDFINAELLKEEADEIL